MLNCVFVWIIFLSLLYCSDLEECCTFKPHILVFFFFKSCSCDAICQQRLTLSSLRWCGGIMACISATSMLLVTQRETLIVKSNSSCTVSFLSWAVEVVAKRRSHRAWKDCDELLVMTCSCLFQTGLRSCWSSSVLSCSSSSSAYAAVSAAHRSAAATCAAHVVHRHAAAQKKVEKMLFVWLFFTHNWHWNTIFETSNYIRLRLKK